MRSICYEFDTPLLTLNGARLPTRNARFDLDPNPRSAFVGTFEIETTASIAKKYQLMSRYDGSVDAALRGRYRSRVTDDLEFRFKWQCGAVVTMFPSNGNTAWLSGPVRGKIVRHQIPDEWADLASSEWVIQPVNPWGRWD